jgi:hypothetical protein
LSRSCLRGSALWRLLLFILALVLPALSGEADGRRPKAPGGRATAAVVAVGRPDVVRGPGRSLAPRAARTQPRSPRRVAAKRPAPRRPGPAPRPLGPSDPLQVRALYDFDSVMPAGQLVSSVAVAGNTVLAVGEASGAISTDGGETFRHVDIDALFRPNSSIHWRNRQPQVCYVPSIDRFVLAMKWDILSLLMEGAPHYRLAVATPQEAAADTWTWWQFSDTYFTDRPFGYFGWRRAPLLGVGSSTLYLNIPLVDDGILQDATSQIMARVSLATLAQGGELTLEWYHTEDVTTVGLPNQFGTRAYWAALRGQDSLRVYYWDEGSLTVSWNDLAITPWNLPTPSIVSPNLDWLGNLDDELTQRSARAALTATDLWVAWTAGANPDAGRPHSHVQVARVALATTELAQEFPIHSATFAVAHPSLCSNPDGEVGYAAYTGGDLTFPSLVVGMLTGNQQALPVTIGDHGPVDEAWYSPGIQRAHPYSRLFVVHGYSLKGGAAVENADRVGIVFGRSADIPDQYEPDDDSGTAAVITDPQTHTFHVPGDQDWVYFDLAEPSRVAAFTSGNSTDDDTELTLFDDSLNQLDYDDDDGDERYSRIETGTLQPGRYYLRVNEFGDDQRISSYYLTVQLVSGYLLSGTVTLNGTGFGTQVRLYADPTMAQHQASVDSDPGTGYWEYRAPAGSSFFLKPFKNGFTFSPGWFQENIQNDTPGLNFTAAPASPPQPPSGLLGVGYSSSQVLLAFTDEAGDESGFQVRRGTSAGGPWTVVSPDAPSAPNGGTRFYLVGGLAAKTNYWFQVRALPQQEAENGWVTVGPIKTLKTGDRLFIPTTVKIPKKGKAKVGQTKTLTVKVVNPFSFPIPVGVPQPPTAPFGMTPGAPGFALPASSSGPLNLVFSFTPTTGTPSTQTQQISLTLSLPGADLPIPITLQGSAK